MIGQTLWNIETAIRVARMFRLGIERSVESFCPWFKTAFLGLSWSKSEGDFTVTSY